MVPRLFLMFISISLPDSFKELVESRTDDELSVLLQQALSFPSVTNQLKMLEAIGLSTLQSILDLRKSGVMVQEPTVRKIVPDDIAEGLSVDDLDLSALDDVEELAETTEALVNESVFGKLRAQIMEGADPGV